jgi:hypothetical protein
MANHRLIQRKDTEANWSAVVPAEGEIAFVDSGANAGRFKIGDGSTTYAGLGYATPETPNPAGGQDNFLPIAGPTATGTAEAETLAVTSSAGLAVDDPANVAATITADQFQEGSLLTVKSDAGDSLLDIDNIGNAVVDPGHVTIGDPLAARVEIGPASGSQDGTIKAVGANNQDVFGIIPANIGSVLSTLLLNSASVEVFEALGDGRVLKTGTHASNDDLLNRTELDARYITNVFRPQRSDPNALGYVESYFGVGGGIGVTMPSNGTHILVFWQWTYGGNGRNLLPTSSDGSGVVAVTGSPGSYSLVSLDPNQVWTAFSIKVA